MACRDEAYARHFGGRGGGDGAVHDALVLNEEPAVRRRGNPPAAWKPWSAASPIMAVRIACSPRGLQGRDVVGTVAAPASGVRCCGERCGWAGEANVVPPAATNVEKDLPFASSSLMASFAAGDLEPSEAGELVFEACAAHRSVYFLVRPALEGVVEAAPGLRSALGRGGRRRSLVIRPTFLGPAAMLGVVLLLFVQICTVLATFEDHRINLAIMTLNVMSAALGSHSLRAYFHWVDSCCRQLTQFAVAKAETNCCRVNHVESGKRIACDRETILECVRAWFGSEEAFESMVRHQVSSTLMGLGQGALPVSWFMGMNSCALWIFFDLIVARLRAAEYFYSLAALINMLATVFAFAPLVYLLCLFAAYKLRRPQQHRCSNLTVSFLGAIGVVVIFILYTQLGAIFTPAVPHAVLRSLLLALATALASMLACRMWMATST
ncbi:Mannosyltransferase [Durusdinium trenchii]|uniref:Mannosyltransferase n=1 Tax=Durusdinium trenchii TaxID=1381693 RepID=A0ABP0IV98_9DINO